MNQNGLKQMNPLIVIASIAVILTCLLAIGVMTGIVPSPMARDSDAVVENKAAAPAPRSNIAENRSTARAPAPARDRSPVGVDRAPVGTTSSSAAGGTVAGGSDVGRNVAAVCNNCGTVTSVRVVKQQGDAGLVGPIAGGAVGGLAGHQVGSGSGQTIATIAGAAVGAAAGTEIERRYKGTTSYVVGVKLNDGTTRSFTYGTAPGYQQGDRVRIVDGHLVKDS